MLTHSIKFTKPEVKKSTWPWQQGNQNKKPPEIPWFQNIGSGPKKLGKLEYARFIAGFPHAINDVVVFHTRVNSNGDVDYNNLIPGAVYVIKDIQQMHGFVDYSSDGKPKALQLTPSDNNGEFWTTHDTWTVVNVSKLPEFIQKILRDRNPVAYARSYNSFHTTSLEDSESDPVG